MKRIFVFVYVGFEVFFTCKNSHEERVVDEQHQLRQNNSEKTAQKKFIMKKSLFVMILFIGNAMILYAQTSNAEPSKTEQTLATALLGAVIALFGYIGKNIIEWFKRIQKNKQQKYAFLIELNSLLNATNDVFKKQQEMRERLIERLQNRLKINLDNRKSYERLIKENYLRFNDDEKDLHGIIRGYTIALFGLNTGMLDWLKKDYFFKTTQNKKDVMLSFAKKLNLLESHLHLWVAKYNVWIPDSPMHALVYLADEEHHGTSFPTGIEDEVQNILSLNLL